MNGLFEILLAFGGGALFGVCMTCCLVMASKADEDTENKELGKNNTADGTDVS